MADYASIKGRAAVKAQETPRRAPPPALPDNEAARVEANRQFVFEHLPELAPLVRALYAEGLIDGWRAITKCELNERTQ